ncbi:MAG: hypothetical protein PWP52_1802 [Bacteroidales bacterium]|nr:hypothetical protein [Bacteroidales bacterium]
MKKIVSILVLLILTTPVLMAQNTLKDVVREYQRKNSEFTMVIPSFILKTGLTYGDLEDEEREFLQQIDRIKIVVSDKGFRNNEFILLDNGIKEGRFKEIMTVYDQKDKVRMVYHQKNNRKSELLGWHRECHDFNEPAWRARF